MKSRIAIGSWLLIVALIGCGDDSSSSSDKDAGPDGGGNVSGNGGGGGTGGSKCDPSCQSAGGKGGQNAGGVGGEGAGGTGAGGSGGSEDVTYSIGGEVSGLKGGGLVLVLNDGNDLSINKDGGFTFDKKLAKDQDYRVSVKTQPSGQACAVNSGQGSVGEEDIEGVQIVCSDVQRSIGGSVTGLGGGSIILKNNSGDDLTVSTDGSFTFHSLLKPGAGYEVSIGTGPSGRTCSLTKGSGTLGGDNVTDVKIACYAGITVTARARPGSVGLTWTSNGADSYTVYATSKSDCNFDDFDNCTAHATKPNVTSPYVWSELENGTGFFFQVRGNHPDSFTTRSNTTGARPNNPVFDKEVNALTLGNGTVYVGGAFSSVGALTGPIAPLDKTTGLASKLPNFPIFPGNISDVISDGSGGYFVAGKFDYEVDNNNTIHNLAHVTKAGAIDPTWKPEPGSSDVMIPNPTVRAIALSSDGNTLYLAGNFNLVGSGSNNARAGLAAVSAKDTGALSAWNPGVTPTGSVFAIIPTATTVYVGGRFTAIGADNARAGLARAGVAALALDTGNATAWNPDTRTGAQPTDPEGEVVALALSGDTVYVSGDFDHVGGVAHVNLAAVSASGTGAPTAFVASPDSPPTSLAATADVLYIGGLFTTVGSDMRNRLAALNAGTGAVQSWNPNADDAVQDLVVLGDTIYVVGDFLNIASKARKYAAAIDKSGALVETWDPRPNAGATSVTTDGGDTVYVASSNDALVTFGSEQYAGVAAFKGNSLLTWNAAVSGGPVLALTVSGSNVYVGGTFTKVGDTTLNGLASLTADTAALNGWNAGLASGAEVHALVSNNDNVYAGGKFTLGSRTNLVALKTSDASIGSSWSTTTTTGGTNVVESLALDGSDLYVGGSFNAVNGTSPTGLARVSSSTGAVDNTWTTEATGGSVRALAFTDTVLFAGGTFANLGGSPHPTLGAITKASGVVATWTHLIAADPVVNGLATGTGNALYVGGEFTTVGPAPVMMTDPSNSKLGLVEFSSTSPYAQISGSPNTSGPLGPGVNAVLWTNNTIYLAGSFVSAGGNRSVGLYIATQNAPN